MSRNKRMILSIIIVVIVLGIIVGVWWHVFFGMPNPPLPRADVSLQSATGAASGGNVSSVTSSTAGASGVTSAPILSGENPPLAEEPLAIASGSFSVEIASTSIEQTRGLSYRPSLGANDGMIFIFGAPSVQTFWMLAMNFPLDMIWISGNTVVGFAQNVPAPAPGAALWQLPIYRSPSDTDKVLEVNAGTVAKYNIKVGDLVTIGPVGQ